MNCSAEQKQNIQNKKMVINSKQDILQSGIKCYKSIYLFVWYHNKQSIINHIANIGYLLLYYDMSQMTLGRGRKRKMSSKVTVPCVFGYTPSL